MAPPPTLQPGPQVEALDHAAYFLDLARQAAELTKLMGDMGAVLLEPQLQQLLQDLSDKAGGSGWAQGGPRVALGALGALGVGPLAVRAMPQVMSFQLKATQLEDAVADHTMSEERRRKSLNVAGTWTCCWFRGS